MRHRFWLLMVVAALLGWGWAGAQSGTGTSYICHDTRCYSAGKVKPTGCYCDRQVFGAVLDPSVDLAQLRARLQMFTTPLDRAQGGPGTLYIFTNDALFVRALNGGYTLNSLAESGRSAVLTLTFPR